MNWIRIQEVGTPLYAGWMQPAYYDPATAASAALPHSPSYGHMHPFYTGVFIRLLLVSSPSYPHLTPAPRSSTFFHPPPTWSF